MFVEGTPLSLKQESIFKSPLQPINHSKIESLDNTIKEKSSLSEKAAGIFFTGLGIILTVQCLSELSRSHYFKSMVYGYFAYKCVTKGMKLFRGSKNSQPPKED